MPFTRIAVACVVLAGLAGCVVERDSSVAPASPAGGDRLTGDQIAQSVLATMDRSVDPCQDFYQFACGTWLKTTRLPPDKSRLGRGFAGIRDRNRLVLRDILESAARDPGKDPDLRKIGDFYGACMDAGAIERNGIASLEGALQDIASVTDAASFVQVAGRLQMAGAQVLFRTRVRGDFKDPEVAIAYFLQDGLGLPDRDYYLKDDARSRDLREAYRGHVARMLALLGEPADSAARHAAAILDLETTLARVSLPREETRKPETIYHRMDRAGLARTAPGLPWGAYFDAIGYPDLSAISVGMPAFFATLSAAIPATPIDVLRAYLRWHLLHAVADALPAAFENENFAFYGRTLNGQKEIEPRWKRCVDATDKAMGEILGRYFVERRFGGESKAIAVRMIRGIEASLERAFPTLTWMDDATRARAAQKLAMVRNKIGYPDVWRDYSSLTIRRGDYLADVVAAARFEFRRQHDKIGKPVDRKEWGMTPPTVNAYYNPNLNEMVFPAGIMQPPFFHRDFPRAMNYGGMGMAMGHELTHGFDDQGRKFDGTGQMREWWDPSAVARFEDRARCVEDLYSSYEVEPGLHVNGKLTLGENIADLGGIREAYQAYKAQEASHGAPDLTVPGLTGDQLFFVGFAQTWCEVITPERARLQVTVDPHSPARFRVRGPVSNFPAFAEAFACAPGTPMNPEKQCEVW